MIGLVGLVAGILSGLLGVGGGIVALDGERELTFGPDDEVTVTLHDHAFRSIDVAACMHHAARHHLMRSVPQHALA